MDDTLRSKESTLLRIDRLLVSGGARLVLLLPLLAVMLLGALNPMARMIQSGGTRH